MADSGPTRRESDSMGPIEVPADRYWGAQTERSRRHFAIGAERFPRPFLRALGLVKRAAAEANAALGVLDPTLARAIVVAADEVVEGVLDEHFPLVVWQTGSGTQTNMNANEVIANRASERLGGRLGSRSPVHPNDHVNRSQSSNDAIPTAIHVAALEQTERALLPALRALAQGLEAKAIAYHDVVKVGRTHLMDAVPMRAGDEWGAWATQLRQAIAGIERATPDVALLPLGGTAVGTGLNAPIGFDEAAVAALARATGLPFRVAPDKFAGIAAHDALVALHGSLRTVAVALSKLASDLRLLASGPRTAIAELVLPANEPGSSIMPGKVNPTQCEAMIMVCLQVFANDVAVGLAGAGGQLQLNACKPLLAFNLLNSLRWLADASESLRVHCVEGALVDRRQTRDHVERSLMLATALAPHIGYDEAAGIAKRAHEEGSTLREAALASGRVRAEDFDTWVRPEAMIGPDADEVPSR
ncbi:MAG: class II fumarate hydratase [Deltaproteobacteria bacterium]|nr:class II fumarate hydratase [Deltaproteobacteria bacterium]